MQRHFYDSHPDLHPVGLHRHRRREYQRVSVDRFSYEVVLRDPYGVEPQLLDQFGLLKAVLDGLVVAGWIEVHGIEKVTEPHVGLLRRLTRASEVTLEAALGAFAFGRNSKRGNGKECSNAYLDGQGKGHF